MEIYFNRSPIKASEGVLHCAGIPSKTVSKFTNDYVGHQTAPEIQVVSGREMKLHALAQQRFAAKLKEEQRHFDEVIKSADWEFIRRAIPGVSDEVLRKVHRIQLCAGNQMMIKLLHVLEKQHSHPGGGKR